MMDSTTREDTMQKRNVLIAGSLGATAALIASGAALASNDDDGEGKVTGAQADEATAAALKATGNGRANSVELDSENGATWEVEVTKPDGNTVDVRLDENYAVVVIEGDTEKAD
jgi:uncharacterized membrane protein YkoI